MERLTESNPSWIDDELWERACEPDCEEIDAVYRKLKDYEDLEEQGRLIKLPCKIGDKVWHISGRAIKEDVISGIEYSYDGMFYIWSNEDTWLGGFNDIVFLTKSEAEAKLKELRGEENGN
jgi:hypothetical protein